VAVITIGVLIGGGLGLRERIKATESARTTSAAAAAKASASAPASPASPTPTTTLAPAPVKAAPVASVARLAAPAAPVAPPRETTGRLLTDALEKGHRIFVDGRFAGEGGAPLVVRCGRHDVRVGSAGRLRSVDVPCGGDLSVAR
jgi:hypothetical protein